MKMMFFKKWFGPKLKPVIYEKATHHFDVGSVDKNAITVLKQLSKCGFSAYVVGGAIRDQLLKIPSKDCDVVTDAKPEKIVKKVKRTMLIGRRFRIVHARFGRDIVEISTFRSNISSRRRKISREGIIKRDNIYGTIDEDVMRRDFTINALYYDYHEQTILDFVGGMDDLVARRLRSIGDPMERFPEDPVRMLRAIRFAAKLELKVDPEILEAIQKHKSLLKEISGQRLFAEVVKLYYSGNAKCANQMLIDTEVIHILMPELRSMKQNKQAFALWDTMATSADKRFKSGRRLSIVYLFACLYWPIFIAKMAKKRLRNFSSQAATEVLVQSIYEIPARTREDVLEIWQNQYQFKCRDKSVNRLKKSKRLRASYELLCQRAVVDPSLSDLALYWSEHVNG